MTWLIATRERISSLRSLRAISHASVNMTITATHAFIESNAATERHDLVSKLDRAVEFVRTQDDRCSSRGRIANEGIDNVASIFVEAGMRFIK